MIKTTHLFAAFVLFALFANSASAVLVDALFDRTCESTTVPDAVIIPDVDTIGTTAGPTAILSYVVAGESMTLTLQDSSATLGSSVSDTATVNFLGFTGFNL